MEALERNYPLILSVYVLHLGGNVGEGIILWHSSAGRGAPRTTLQAGLFKRFRQVMKT